MTLPPAYTREYILQSILDLCKRNNVERAGRVRVTVFRNNGTLYTTEDQYASIIIQAEPLAPDYLKLNETGFKLDVYTDVKKSCDILANLKSNNYLPYVMAAMHSRQQQLNDCLVLNTYDRICDAGIANLFWIRDNIIYTPPLSEGGVAGVMRQYLFNRLPGAGYKIQERVCTVHDIQAADEVFLTNALYGIRWVQNVGATQYRNQLTMELYNYFVKTLHQVQ
jgi:branched-chain amino acid aminotransferase